MLPEMFNSPCPHGWIDLAVPTRENVLKEPFALTVEEKHERRSPVCDDLRQRRLRLQQVHRIRPRAVAILQCRATERRPILDGQIAIAAGHRGVRELAAQHPTCEKVLHFATSTEGRKTRSERLLVDDVRPEQSHRQRDAAGLGSIANAGHEIGMEEVGREDTGDFESSEVELTQVLDGLRQRRPTRASQQVNEERVEPRLVRLRAGSPEGTSEADRHFAEGSGKKAGVACGREEVGHALTFGWIVTQRAGLPTNVLRSQIRCDGLTALVARSEKMPGDAGSVKVKFRDGRETPARDARDLLDSLLPT